ncbi:MAG: GMC family oxidoreductase [Terricaulis sp.]|nr:GMC family oxidoreductase [Terricaulis sp.]
MLACGGLGVLRLLLLAQHTQPALFGGADGPLGRGYMGHLTGSISAITLTDPAGAQAFACRMLERGVFARRRLRPTDAALRAEPFGNIAFWLDNPSEARNNVAAIARALATRLAALAGQNGQLGLHIRKFARAPISAAVGLSGAVFQLLYAKLSGGYPGAVDLIADASGAWRLCYHGEQMRNAHNRVRLHDARDSLGLPKLAIDFHMNDADFESVLAAHEALDADLRASGLGALRFDAGRAETRAAIASAARDGYHQLGGAAMSADPSAGVVNAQCRAHDVENLWIASSCVFASGGQANPTLTIIALARRLAAALAGRA